MPGDAHRALLRRFRDAQSPHVPRIPPVPEGEPRPFWSVVIPAFEGDPVFLAETLERVLGQDPGPAKMEIAVIDDGTTTYDVERVVRRTGGSRVRFRRPAGRLGVPGSWNAGVEDARGWWVHLLRQDDVVLEGFYACLREAAERHPDVGAVLCRGGGLDAGGRPTWTQEPERATPGALGEEFLHRLAAGPRILTPAIAIRRAVYEEIGGYHGRLPYCADWDLYRRVVLHSPVWYEPRCLARDRQHVGSATRGLQACGEDVADRRLAIELGRAYLPPDVAAATEAAARGATLGWAADVLREAVGVGDLRRALRQAREIVRVIEAAEAAGDRTPAVDGHGGLLRRVAELEAQVEAWARAASALAREGDRRGDR